MNEKESKTGFDLLPNVILDLIFSRLLIEDVVSMMKTCKKLNNFRKRDSYWKKLIERQEVINYLEKIEGDLYSQIHEMIIKYPHLAIYFTERIGNCIQFETLSGEMKEIKNTIKNKFQKKIEFSKGVNNYQIVMIGGGSGSCDYDSSVIFFYFKFFFFTIIF